MEDFDYISDSLYRTKIREMDEQLLLWFGKDGSLGTDVLGSLVQIAVDKVVNYFNRLSYCEFLDGSFPQIIRDCRDSIALFDRESRYGKIRGILSNQRDVGAVDRK